MDYWPRQVPIPYRTWFSATEPEHSAIESNRVRVVSIDRPAFVGADWTAFIGQPSLDLELLSLVLSPVLPPLLCTLPVSAAAAAAG